MNLRLAGLLPASAIPARAIGAVLRVHLLAGHLAVLTLSGTVRPQAWSRAG